MSTHTLPLSARKQQGGEEEKCRSSKEFHSVHSRNMCGMPTTVMELCWVLWGINDPVLALKGLLVMTTITATITHTLPKPGTVLSALHTSTYSILIMALWGRYYHYYPHLTGPQKSFAIHPRLHTHTRVRVRSGTAPKHSDSGGPCSYLLHYNIQQLNAGLKTGGFTWMVRPPLDSPPPSQPSVGCCKEHGLCSQAWG